MQVVFALFVTDTSTQGLVRVGGGGGGGGEGALPPSHPNLFPRRSRKLSSKDDFVLVFQFLHRFRDT